jgi:hypothetical protein
MAEIVNLRMARKAKARRDADVQAAGNRAKFGRQKAADDAARDALARHVDAHALRDEWDT